MHVDGGQIKSWCTYSATSGGSYIARKTQFVKIVRRIRSSKYVRNGQGKHWNLKSTLTQRSVYTNRLTVKIRPMWGEFSSCGIRNLGNFRLRKRTWNPEQSPRRGIQNPRLSWIPLYGEKQLFMDSNNWNYYHYTRPNDKLPSLKRWLSRTKRRSAGCTDGICGPQLIFMLNSLSLWNKFLRFGLVYW